MGNAPRGERPSTDTVAPTNFGLDKVAEVYGSVITAGVYPASSIKVAEAAKVIENTQRDLNIALVNELSLIFQRIGIDTTEVLQAAGTKWNFLPFRPGLVGGHCIGVDPYYLTHKADMLGYHPQVILAGRRINDSMGKYVAEQTVKRMIAAGELGTLGLVAFGLAILALIVLCAVLAPWLAPFDPNAQDISRRLLPPHRPVWAEVHSAVAAVVANRTDDRPAPIDGGAGVLTSSVATPRIVASPSGRSGSIRSMKPRPKRPRRRGVGPTS